MNVQTLSREALEAQIAELMAANAKLKAAGQRKLSVKVSEKGALCVYGLGRFPVSLYASQWEKLVDFVKAGAIDEALKDNEALLSRKD